MNPNTVSPLERLPFDSKYGPSYQTLPVSRKRKRKIEHVQRLIKSGRPKQEIRNYALHGMNMHPADVVEAFRGAN